MATRLAAAQAQLGHDVSILSYRFNDAEQGIARLLDGVPGGQRIRIDLLPVPNRIERFLGTAARPRLQAVCSQANVLHLHGVWESLLRVAGQAAAGRAPYVVAPHGMLDPWSLSQRRWKKQLALAFGYRAMLNRAAFLHVLNDDEARLLAPLSLKAPGRVLPNGVFLEEIPDHIEPGQFRARHGVARDRRVVLFLGRLHHKKGLDYLASALPELAKQVPDCHVVVAGPDGGALEPFRQQLRTLGVEQRVSIVGPLYGHDRFAAIADADCFVLPSRQEGFSMAILEAMACGKPVVISDACHFPDVAQGAGIIVPLNAQALAQALARVLANPTDAAAMGAFGQQLVSERYTWNRIAERSIALYHDAMDA